MGEYQTARYRDKPMLHSQSQMTEQVMILYGRKMRSLVKPTMSLTLKKDSETHWCLMTLTGLHRRNWRGKIVCKGRSSDLSMVGLLKRKVEECHVKKPSHFFLLTRQDKSKEN